MLFRPNLPCVLTKKGSYDGYGQMLPGKAIRERCAIVELVKSSAKTSVRADQSASRGEGEEMVVESTILLTAKTQAEISDGLVIGDVELRITSMSPKHAINGVLDHYVVKCVIAATE